MKKACEGVIGVFLPTIIEKFPINVNDAIGGSAIERLYVRAGPSLDLDAVHGVRLHQPASIDIRAGIVPKCGSGDELTKVA
jgi:hypothetical protein